MEWHSLFFIILQCNVIKFKRHSGMKAAATARYNHEIKTKRYLQRSKSVFFTQPLKGRADESRTPAFLAPAAALICVVVHAWMCVLKLQKS